MVVPAVPAGLGAKAIGAGDEWLNRGSDTRRTADRGTSTLQTPATAPLRWVCSSLRAELPGFDPEHDIQVTADEGLLTISAKREAKEGNGKHTEFQYGAFTRTTRLPSGADTNHITATYDNGILQITVPVVPRGKKQEVSIKVAKG